MRKATLTITAFLLVLISCKKNESPSNSTDPDPTSTTTPSGSNPYYFKFNFRTISYNLASAQAGYPSIGINQAGGYIDTLSITLNHHFPSISVIFSWPTGHKVTEAELLALKGKTIRFNEVSPAVSMTFDRDDIEPTWHSDYLNNSKYFVKIDNITFLKNDEANYKNVKVYVITGSCVASMSKYTADIDNSGEITNGQFNLRICMIE